MTSTTDRTIAHFFHACKAWLGSEKGCARLAGESWNVIESENIFDFVLATYLEHFKAESIVVHTNGTILRSMRITVR
jgi:hypothetical protein